MMTDKETPRTRSADGLREGSVAPSKFAALVKRRNCRSFGSQPPNSAPQTKARLRGPRKTFGAPFAQDDSGIARSTRPRGLKPASLLGQLMYGLKPVPFS